MVKKHKSRWAITDRMFLSLFFTGAIIEFSQVGSGFIDGLVISRFLGSDAMAASGIVYPVFSIIGTISGLLAVGMQVRCAQEIGRGDQEAYARFVSAAVYAGIILSLIIAALLVVFAKPFAILLGASGNAASLAETASQYLFGISLGAPPLIMIAILAPALQLDTGHRIVQTAAIIQTIVNLVLDFVAVKMGWGIFGIGIATAAASYSCFLYQCIFFLKKDRMLHFVKPDISVKEFMHMIAGGSETAVKRLANTLRPVFLNNIIISYGGVAAMSALSIRNNFSNFAEIFGAGIASAVALLTAVYYGEVNEEGIEEVNRCSHRMIARFSGIFGLLMVIFAGQIAHLYIAEDGAAYDMTVFAIRMLGLQVPLQALIQSRIKYLQATNKRYNMNFLTILTKFIFVILSAFLLGSLFGSYGIIACYTVSDGITLIAIYIYYAIKNRKAWPARKEFLDLPDHFHLYPGDLISLDIHSQEEASLASEQLMMFCKGHKISRRLTYYASLAVEELASNIVKHGFPVSHTSKPMIDLRAVITSHSLVIRLCDNCLKFDITKEIAAAKQPSGDPMHNIGTRIISSIASDITYMRTFDTNNLILSFHLDH